MKTIIHLLVLPLTFLASRALADSNCPLAFPKAGVCATPAWMTGPAASIENKMTLQIFDPQTQAAVEPTGQLKVALFMPDMGHGSRPTTLTRLQAGLFQVNKMYFTMEGHWEVRVSLDGEQVVLPVDIQ